MLKRGSGGSSGRQTEVKKKREASGISPHDELIGQGIQHKVEVQTKAAASALKPCYFTLIP